MGDALPHRKPLLGQGELLPAAGPDAPAHAPGGLVGGEARAVPEDGAQPLQPPVVVLQQGVHPGRQLSPAPVAGQGQPDGQPPHGAQAVQIAAQGVLHLQPGGDVGGDVEEDVVAGEEDPLPLVPEAHLPRRVAGHGEAAQAAGPRLHHGAGRQGAVAVGISRGQGPGGVGRVLGQQLRWEALGPEQLVPPGPLGLVRVLQVVPVGAAGVDPPRLPHHLRRQAGVVGVEVGEHHVHVPPVHPQLGQAGEEGPAARLLPEAGVDQNPALPAGEQIAVQLPQRVARQGHRDAVQSL